MAIANKINLETRFQLNTTPDEIIRIKDTTDYASESIALSDVVGALKITSPLGSVFHNTVLPAFDIDLDVQDYIDTITLPTDSSGDVLKGVYVVEYSIKVTGAVQPGTYTDTFTYNYCYDEIIPNVGVGVNLINSTFTSTDNTSYPVELTSNTLTHTIFPPSSLDPVLFPPQVVSTVVNTYTGISTQTWTGKISNILELTFTATGVYSEHIIDVTITGATEKNIKDDINICSLQCNMRALTARYASALSTNPIDAVRIQNDQVTPALLNSFMYTSNIKCGNFEKAEFYYNEVLKYTGSNPECACDDSEVPTLILASGGGGGGNNTYVVDVCNTNSALSVTSNTVGDETTYTICFDDTLWVKINSLSETVITSVDSSITVVPVVSGDIITWDLSVSSSPTLDIHSFSGIMDIDMTNTNTNPPSSILWRSGWSTVVGNKLQEPTIVNVNNTPSLWQSNSNEFYLEGYIDQSGGEFPKPQLQIAEDFYNKRNGLVINITKIDTSSNRIYFSFVYGSSALPISGSSISETWPFLTISVIINA